MKLRKIQILGVLCALAASFGWGAEPAAGAKGAPKGDPYPLDVCVVSGKKLDTMGAPVIQEFKGRELRFCCSQCPGLLEKDPAKYLKPLDEKIIAAQKPYYPLDTCVVSGDKLGGDMGAPIDYVYKNRLIRFCCKSCIKDFEEKPAKYLKTLDEAVVEKQKPGYPLKKCPVSGDEIGGAMGEPLDCVIGNRLMRLCCKSCPKDLAANPVKYMGVFDEALKAAGKPDFGKARNPASAPSKAEAGAEASVKDANSDPIGVAAGSR